MASLDKGANRTALSKSSSLHAPIPVCLSGVMLAETTLPNGVSIGRPPAKGAPPSGRVWQAAQSPTVTR
jgi:hypothetical protein